LLTELIDDLFPDVQLLGSFNPHEDEKATEKISPERIHMSLE
jgi:hypothetical protein